MQNLGENLGHRLAVEANETSKAGNFEGMQVGHYLIIRDSCGAKEKILENRAQSFVLFLILTVSEAYRKVVLMKQSNSP